MKSLDKREWEGVEDNGRKEKVGVFKKTETAKPNRKPGEPNRFSG